MTGVLSLVVSVDTVLLLVGVVCLYLGAELLVSSAASVALGYGMRATTVGVTIVAFATTAPELIVSTVGVVTASDQIALGNIVGSNIANIGLVLGASALLSPTNVDSALVRKHGPFMLAAVVALVVLGLDQRLGAVDGGALLSLLLVYTVYLLLRARNDDTDVVPEELSPDSDGTATWRNGLELVGAGVFLFAGSRGLILGGRGILSSLGFGDLFIGLTIIAVGTSLPELATSLVSAYRDGAAFSIGNVIGSNIYNVLAVVGIVAIIVPIEVSATTQSIEFPLLLGFTVGSLGLLEVRPRISRLAGIALLVSYGGFVYVLLGSYGG